MKSFFRELQKFFLQYIILPPIYYFYAKYNRNTPDFVVLADAKHNEVPYSMKAIHAELEKRHYKIVLCCNNMAQLNIIEKFSKIIAFMKYYSRAKYVFICDYYIPVSSCNKKKCTKVIQLWHSSGLQKTFGYDADDDLGKMYFTNPVKNFDLVCVSSPYLKSFFKKAWHLKDNQIKAFGTSRTDILYDEEYKNRCKNDFFNKYPAARNKKIILWAPTFRGNGAHGHLVGVKDILELKESLSNDYFVLIKVHPNVKDKYDLDNCDIETEKLYFVVDILITDYSSIFYDFLLLEKDIIIFAPDYEEYKKRRGLYISYEEQFPFHFVKDKADLYNVILNLQTNNNCLKKFKKLYLASCDGNVSSRILDYLESEKCNLEDGL